MKRTVQLKGLAGRGEEILRKRKAEIITGLFKGVVSDTPVKTGHLKANYKVSKGSPNTSVDSSTVDPTPTVESTVQALVTAGNEKIFLSNGVPYGPIIEYLGGSPQKAPQGMVRINILKTVSDLRARRNK